MAHDRQSLEQLGRTIIYAMRLAQELRQDLAAYLLNMASLEVSERLRDAPAESTDRPTQPEV